MGLKYKFVDLVSEEELCSGDLTDTFLLAIQGVSSVRLSDNKIWMVEDMVMSIPDGIFIIEVSCMHSPKENSN